MSRIALCFVVALLAVPAVAHADDASLFGAYNAEHAALNEAGQSYIDASIRFARAETRRQARRALRAVVRADRGLNTVLRRAEAGIEGQQASTDGGGRASAHALEEVRGWIAANKLEMRAIGALLDGRIRRATRLLLRAERRFTNALDQGQLAVREFAAVGLTHPEGSLSIPGEDETATAD